LYWAGVPGAAKPDIQVTPSGEVADELAAGLDPQLESTTAELTMANDSQRIPFGRMTAARNLDTVRQDKTSVRCPPESPAARLRRGHLTGRDPRNRGARGYSTWSRSTAANRSGAPARWVK
jgi:hypothetical protein